MQVQVFEKLTGGVKGSTVVADLTDKCAEDGIAFSRAAFWGDLTAEVTFAGTLEEAFTFADRYLGNGVEIRDPFGTLQWGGYIWGVKFSHGGRTRERSLEGYANYVYVWYQTTDFSTDPPTVLPGPAIAFSASDATQEAIYGRIEHHLRGGQMTMAGAVVVANRTLAERTRLLWLPSGQAAETDGPATITLSCFGWYNTLFYYAPYDTTTGSTTVENYITTRMAFAALLSSNRDRIGSTGGTSFPWRDGRGGVLLGERIKAAMRHADGYTFGVDSERVPYLEANRRMQTTADYVELLDGSIVTPSGQPVPLYEVRPDRVLKQAGFVPPSSVFSAATDSIEHVYLAETEWRSPNELTYKPAVAGVGGSVDP